MPWSEQEEWAGQQTGVTIEEDGVKGQSDVTRVFNLVPPAIGATTNDALAALSVRANDPHPQNSALRARRFSVSQRGPMYFEIQVGYEASTRDPNDPAQNPLTQPSIVTFSSVTQEVEIDEDVNGDPIQTVNGEPIEGVTRPFTDLVITVQRNLPSFSPASISEYTNKVNSATWYGLPAGTVRITDIQARNVFSDDFAYWDVTISFQVRRGFGPVTDARAWWYRTAHQGYSVWNGTQLVQAKTADSVTVAQPVMIQTIDDDGIQPGQGAQVAAGVGRYIEFQVLEEIDFNQLNLL